MAKTTEAATIQVCSLKLATSVRVFSRAPLESGRLEMLSVSGIVTHTAAARWWCNTKECRSLADNYRWACCCDGNETWLVQFELPIQGSLNGAGDSSELNVNSFTELEILNQNCTLLLCYLLLLSLHAQLVLPQLYFCLVQLTSPDYSQVPERRALTQPHLIWTNQEFIVWKHFIPYLRLIKQQVSAPFYYKLLNISYSA